VEGKLTFASIWNTVEVKARRALVSDDVATEEKFSATDFVADGACAARAGVTVSPGNAVLTDSEVVGRCGDGEAEGGDDDGKGVHAGRGSIE
jgi:hypothetical protein